MELIKVYNCVFKNCLGESIVVKVNQNVSIEHLIHSYFVRKEKENLFVDNIEKTYFIFDGLKIKYKNNEDEVITFSHRAYSRAIFGKGAIAAAKYLGGKPAGMYDMSDVLA